MAYLSAAHLAARSQPPTFDPIWHAGMPAFRDHPRPERYSLIDSYPRERGWYNDALGKYMDSMAIGIGLVCTANEVQRGEDQDGLIVGVGLAARGAAAVVEHELIARLKIMEARYHAQKGARRRLAGFVTKNGPVETIARKARYTELPQSADQLAEWMTGDLRPTIGRAMAASSDNQTTVEAAALTVVEGIVPVQTELELAAYQEIPVQWPPSQALQAR